MLGIGIGRSQKKLPVDLDIHIPPYRSAVGSGTEVTWRNNAKLGSGSSGDPLILKHPSRQAIAVTRLPIPEQPLRNPGLGSQSERCRGKQQGTCCSAQKKLTLVWHGCWAYRLLFTCRAPQARVDKSDRCVRTLVDSRRYRPARRGVCSIYCCPIADSSPSSPMLLSDGKPALAILAVSPSRGSLGAPAFQPARRRHGSMPRRRRLAWHDASRASGRPAAHDGRSPGSSAAGRAPGASSPRRKKPAESRRSQFVPARRRGRICGDTSGSDPYSRGSQAPGLAKCGLA